VLGEVPSARESLGSSKCPESCYTGFVRGDSLRDFYAKSIALLGLAALAGVGALVDYWPTDLGVPRDIARALPRPAPSAIIEPADQDDVRSRFGARRATRLTSRPVTAAPVAVAEAAPVSAPTEPDLTALTLTVASASMTDLPTTALALELPPPPPIAVAQVEPEIVAQAIPLAAPVAAPESASSPTQLLTQALRRTGHSILHTGAKIGEKTVEALGAVRGAFRKVPWFNSAPASRPIG